MTRYFLICAALLALAACNQPARQPLATPAAMPPSGNLSGCPGAADQGGCDSYKAGIAAGKADKAAGQSAEYRRHQGEFDGRNEMLFRQGYANGYFNDGR
ncbi:hypothetical protein LG047_01695 [Methylocystis sp. WRRC1]|uniref:hypothetical protein n=1 Tax=Methylocystis sp. WRRC1 TaxID=1732014 RepID=UPI001D151AF5|nr:hypothetical protein [Methylocystis sp. WRRC1]MCC3244042.1 hypothetical protein [Methylocystis sp. WRRC1]